MMRLYLFGGAETDQGQAPKLKQLINKVLAQIRPRQLLHIPYARIKVPKGEEDVWGEGWVSKDLDLKEIELLDARNAFDIERADKPTIFMNGGPQIDLLYEKITSDKSLYNLVMNANFIIGESAGSMISGEYIRTYKKNKAVVTKGLGILKETIIEAHYTQRRRYKLLRKEMKQVDAKYGIGIDSLTAAIIDTKTYPDKYQTIGYGLVEFIRKENLK
ncbi:MAG: Cyanophycinase [Candidatus Woesebacteria bacterium GW2011_GWB1_39_12]|uniref:Cyanophycinase n=2 Tax=Candidatus Woeseibacteriota TaxID=1752722 RepID=A0A0G0LXF9_9BACT|nr:MAG: Cyanophycinase [Candidatus Woesebacteria bacterium GW2011_GWA1_39_12]KKR01751.1 MAG: Cyanophycinase [Candidatus Woesebacteria bacterium GW2011_GWB1_39_12]